MKKNYFENIKTLEDLKKAYKKLVLELHPDANKEKDTTKEFIEMKKQYEEKFEKVKNTFINSKGEYYEKENNETPQEFADIIDKIINLENVKIEIIGTWIWLTGDTKEYKDYLKELHFNWSKDKVAWYYHTEPFRKRSKKLKNMDELRTLFETTEIKRNGGKVQLALSM